MAKRSQLASHFSTAKAAGKCTAETDRGVLCGVTADNREAANHDSVRMIHYSLRTNNQHSVGSEYCLETQLPK